MNIFVNKFRKLGFINFGSSQLLAERGVARQILTQGACRQCKIDLVKVVNNDPSGPCGVALTLRLPMKQMNGNNGLMSARQLAYLASRSDQQPGVHAA